ncbi:MAG: hypothetical protein JWQ10_619 [Herbaspirillum sp.]|jgi:hypothetical protein|nr:hypothetical protein [Herbaspirillum sp.]
MQAAINIRRRGLALLPVPALLSVLLLALAGCSTAPSAAKQDASLPARLGLKLSPASLGQTLSLQQHLKVERAGRTDELDTALEIDADQLTLVGLAFGQRVMTLQYDGHELKTWRHVMLPPQVRGEDVLEDMQLTLWPAAAIRAALPSGWDLQDSAPGTPNAPNTPSAHWQRTLSFEAQPIMVIDYAGPQRWGGQVVLNNLRYHYRLTITSADVDANHDGGS